jgi:hypothetical protein
VRGAELPLRLRLRLLRLLALRLCLDWLSQMLPLRRLLRLLARRGVGDPNLG